VIQRDLAFYHAMEESVRRGLLEPSNPPVRRRWEACYVLEDFPDAMQLLKQNDGPFRCNFDPGSGWDIEKMIEERRGRSRESWGSEWRDYPGLDFVASDIVRSDSVALQDRGVHLEHWGPTIVPSYLTMDHLTG
jgi:hypothetical protein